MDERRGPNAEDACSTHAVEAKFGELTRWDLGTPAKRCAPNGVRIVLSTLRQVRAGRASKRGDKTGQSGRNFGRGRDLLCRTAKAVQLRPYTSQPLETFAGVAQ